MTCRKGASVLFLIVAFFSFAASAFGLSEEEKSFLSMYFTEDELQVVSATRSLKSIARVAENVEVVMAEDIELMNAHTLADVLNAVNGVQVIFGGASPTSLANVSIQGSKLDEVAFFLDGVPLNELSSNLVVVSDIPVQMIERVEIIKGPASSVWGSSLGGVVNIITKGSGSKEKVSGTLSASYGEENTSDLRAEAYGKKGKFGYYLTIGRLDTDGLRPVEEGWRNDLYAKATYDLSPDTNVVFTLGYGKTDRERGDLADEFDVYDRDALEKLFSTLSLTRTFGREVALNVSFRTLRQRDNFSETILSTGDKWEDVWENTLYGGSAKLTWAHGSHSVAAGAEYDDGKLDWTTVEDEMHLREWALFANDSITIGKLTVTPGVRFDDSNRFESFFSPSLGVTYALMDKTILRGDVARGFNSPSLGQLSNDFGYFVHNSDLDIAKVWSYQLGVETGIMKYAWLKATAFRHDVKDGIVWDFVDDTFTYWTYVNKERIRRQGLEFQVRTLPFYNVTLSAGAAIIDTEDRATGEEVADTPKYTYDLSLKYDDGKTFRALLKGRYVWFNMSSYHIAKYDSFVFDANVIKELYRKDDSRVELFLTAHNIFNGAQYWDLLYKNADRWIEAGLRYKF